MMHWLFLIPLTTGLCATWFCQKSPELLTYLMGIISVVSFILSLVLAPWQVQLLILLFVVVSFRRIWLQAENTLEPFGEKKKVEPKSIQPQKRASETITPEDKNVWKYRGVSYSPPEGQAKTQEGAIAGKYRGATWTKGNPSEEIKKEKPEKSKSRVPGPLHPEHS